MSRFNTAISISTSVQNSWNEFVAAEQLSESAMEQAEALQSLWQQSAFSARMCMQYPNAINECVNLSQETKNSETTNYELLLRESIRMDDDEGKFKKAIRDFRNQQLLQVCWKDLVLHADVFVLLRDTQCHRRCLYACQCGMAAAAIYC